MKKTVVVVECLVLQDNKEDGLVIMSSSASLSVLRKWERERKRREIESKG